MEQSELQVHMNELAQKIAMLPPGSIVKKTVTGREYYYHRWTENKKRHEKYIPAEVLDSFRAQIEQRKGVRAGAEGTEKDVAEGSTDSRCCFYHKCPHWCRSAHILCFCQTIQKTRVFSTVA